MLLAPPNLQQSQARNGLQQSQHQYNLQSQQQNQKQQDYNPNSSMFDPQNQQFRVPAIPNNHNNNNNLARSIVPSNFEEILNERNSFHTERLDFNTNMSMKPNARITNLQNNNSQFQMVQSISSIFEQQQKQAPINRSQVLRVAAANNQQQPPEIAKPQNLYDSFESTDSQEQLFPRSSVLRVNNDPGIPVSGRYALPADFFISDKNQTNNKIANPNLYDYVKTSAQLMAEKEYQYFSPSSADRIKNPQTLQRNRGIFEGETVKEPNSNSQILQGRGKMLIRNGDIYIGEFWRNSFHGNGLLSFSNGDFYQGKFAYNQMNGKGIYHFFNGDQYKGEFVEDKFSGETSEYSEAATGEVYIGQFFNGLKHGKGKLTNKAGQCVNVEYFKGKRLSNKFQEEEDEKVKKAHQIKQQEQQKQQLQKTKRLKIFSNDFQNLNDSRSRIIETGNLEEFKVVNVNIEAQNLLNQYELILKNKYPANDLVKLFDNGSMFEGSNQYRLTSGPAIFIFPDGNSYAGEWENGLQQGQGMYFDKKVGLYQGAYLNGKKHGYGELIYLNGDQYKGNWVDDHKESEKATYYSVEKQLKSIGKAEHGQFIEITRQPIKCIR